MTAHLTNRVSIAVLKDETGEQTNFQHHPKPNCLCTQDYILQHLGQRNYFGPPDLGSVFDFCQALEYFLLRTEESVELLTHDDGKSYTNTVFLLGAYIIMKLDHDLITTIHCLEPNLSKCIPYEGHEKEGSANLRLQDCLGALQRAKQIRWVDFGPTMSRFDVDEYRELDSPLNADLHEIVPGKVVMMRGPQDLPDRALWRDVSKDVGSFGHRDFSPKHYADILVQLDVQAVVRCNLPAYDRLSFEVAGIAVVDLSCEDCAPPPVDVVAKFLALMELLPGAVAVHCGSGRGRSGTLVAIYLMKHHGFTALEAIGWLRIVRPGWWVWRVAQKHNSIAITSILYLIGPDSF